MNRIGKDLRPCAAACLLLASAGGWAAGEAAQGDGGDPSSERSTL